MSETNTDRFAGTEAERNRVQDIHDRGVDTRHFVIYLQGIEDRPDEEREEPGVEYRMANRLIKNLDILQGISTERPITLSMKTCGGDWIEGMAMYDAILATPNPVSIVVYTHARSMSSIILQAANKRIMLPHSTFMYHEGSTGHEGTPKQVRTEFQFWQIAGAQMLEVYIEAIKRTPHGSMNKWSRKRIGEHLKRQMNDREDVYMLSGEAVRQGFADEIFVGWDEVTQYTPQQLRRK